MTAIMKNRMLLAFTILSAALLFSGFRETVKKRNRSKASLGCVAPKDVKTDLIRDVKTRPTNIIFQSKDGGATWEDISYSLPADQAPHEVFANKSDLYLRINNDLYRSKSNLITPVWIKENVLDPKTASIAFNRAGAVAYRFEGQIYQKVSSTGIWSPIYTNFKQQTVRTIFEASDGAVFIGCENGLYRSADKGRSWKQVFNECWVMGLAEGDGVLIARGQRGIMRSTDHGEHWEWVIQEGGAGIVVERVHGGFVAIATSSITLSRRIYVSKDSGETWNAIDEGLRSSLSISSIKQIGEYLICGHPDGIFRSSDMGKTWKLVHSNLSNLFKINSAGEGQVFEIHVSGNVVYAMLKDSGC
jgi:photosystem II stability/assembly factor-like uncharacterized protein